MTNMCNRSRMMGAVVIAATVLTMTAAPSAQGAGEAFTATAAVKAASGATASAPVTLTLDRAMPQAEADTLTAAFKTGGAAGLRKALTGVPPTGRVQIGSGPATPTRLTIERTTSDG